MVSFVCLSDWQPGQSLFRGTVDGTEMIVKTDLTRAGFRLRYRGADVKRGGAHARVRPNWPR